MNDHYHRQQGQSLRPLSALTAVAGFPATSQAAEALHYAKSGGSMTLLLLAGISVAFYALREYRRRPQGNGNVPAEPYLQAVCSENVVLVWNDKGKIRFRNDKARELFADDFDLLSYLLKLTCGNSPATSPEQILNRLEHEGILQTEDTLQLASGCLRWIAWTHRIAGNSASDAREVISVGHDITHARKQLDNFRQTAGVFEHSRDGIMITDLHGRVLQVNRMFTEMTGKQGEQIIGRQPDFLRSGLTPEQFFAGILEEIPRNGQWQGEIWGRHRDGQLFPCWLSISRVTDEHLPENGYLIGRFTDITEKKEQEKQIAHLAYFDQLTELPNRTLFHDRLKIAIHRADRQRKHIPIIVFNLLQFKQINESLGHEAGDVMLQQVASRIISSVRKSDTVARIGTDEFGIIVDPVATQTEVINVSSRISQLILDSLAQPIDLHGFEAYTSAAIGIVTYPDDGENISILLKNADAAVSHAKHRGPNQALFYEPRMNEKSVLRLRLLADIRRGLERGEFELYYQPTLDLKNSRVSGTEALIRWNHPTLGMILPADFIPLAEETGLIVPLGKWVLATAARQCREWLDKGIPPLRMAINLSLQQLRQPDLDQFIAQTLSQTGLPARHIAMELTESSYMADTHHISKQLAALEQMGIEILIDDFGTGYSSLARLVQLPASAIKIDRSFLRNIEQNGNNASLVSAIIAMGHNLGLGIIAEGIETEAQFELLKKLDCEEAQGFLISEPLPALQCTRFLTQAMDGIINMLPHATQQSPQPAAWKKLPQNNFSN